MACSRPRGCRARRGAHDECRAAQPQRDAVATLPDRADRAEEHHLEHHRRGHQRNQPYHCRCLKTTTGRSIREIGGEGARGQHVAPPCHHCCSPCRHDCHAPCQLRNGRSPVLEPPQRADQLGGTARYSPDGFAEGVCHRAVFRRSGIVDHRHAQHDLPERQRGDRCHDRHPHRHRRPLAGPRRQVHDHHDGRRGAQRHRTDRHCCGHRDTDPPRRARCALIG